ncbi:proteasome subunit beta type-6-like [Ornithodoros turicata]|uniref:proteasome endopeptidase complex n=1 Tax=Ornithodoros turicata TaxID=34597 RepID=A0A2R5LFX9_9ACAR
MAALNVMHHSALQENVFGVPDLSFGVPDWMSEEHSMGTSIMAAEFDGGVVIGADSRTTTGAYVANRVSNKLTKVTDRIFCCRSGSAADTQAISDIVKYHLSFYEMQIGEPAEVQTAASVFRELCYNHRDQLTAGIICAGWDRKKGGQVYMIPLGGMMMRQPIATGGSGSTYIYGYVDANYKEGMTEKECMDFVTKSLALAMSRDGSSGGVIRLGVITKDGVRLEVISGDKLPKFFEG